MITKLAPVVAGQQLRAVDFNAVIAKINELVDAENARRMPVGWNPTEEQAKPWPPWANG